MKPFALAAMLVFVCAFPNLSQSEPRSEGANPATIGALAELTGSFARLGADCRRGYEVAVAHADRRAPVRVVYGDNQNDPKAGISEFRRMRDTEQAGIVVTSRSSVGMALNPLSEQQRVPLVGVVGHGGFVDANPYAIRVFPSAKVEGRALAAYVAEQDEKAVATVTIEDEYFLGLTTQFIEALPAGQVVFSDTVAPSEQEFATLVLRLRAKSPSAVFVNLGPAQIVPFIKRLRESGVQSRIYSSFLVGAEDIRQSLGALGNGLVLVELDYEKPNFLAALKRQTGSETSSPLGYSCYVALTYGLDLAKRQRAGASFNAALLAEPLELETLDGPIRFIDREAVFAVVPKAIRDQELIRANGRK